MFGFHSGLDLACNVELVSVLLVAFITTNKSIIMRNIRYYNTRLVEEKSVVLVTQVKLLQKKIFTMHVGDALQHLLRG